MQITAISLSGFKSFAEPTQIPIDSGLTVIIGPNGCGKSNIIEAVRWVMGEGSAKRLRGSEMEDVIFAGTKERRRRQSAEVCLTLDNSDGLAPPPFQDVSEIVVSRRIERAQGSSYRINNQEVRARDVQLLFADLSIGSRSASIISQGEIADLIESKPDGRRLLLEEAAGVRGVHIRRHDAELQLRQAEGNLGRLADILEHGETELRGLEAQARSTRRYREWMRRKRRYQALHWWIQDRDLAAEQERFEDDLRQKSAAQNRAGTEEIDASAASMEAEARWLAAQGADADAVRLAQESREVLRDLERRRDRWESESLRDVERESEWREEVENVESEIAEWAQRIETLRAEIAESAGEMTKAETSQGLDDDITDLENQIDRLVSLCDAQRWEREAVLREKVRCEERMSTLHQQELAAQDRVRKVQENLANLHSALTGLPEASGDDVGLEARCAAAEEAVQVAYRVWLERRDRSEGLPQAKARLSADAAALVELGERAERSKQRWQAWQSAQKAGLMSCWLAPEGLDAAIFAALASGATAGLDASVGYYWHRRDAGVLEVPSFPEGIPSLWDVLCAQGQGLPEDWDFLRLPLSWVGLAEDMTQCVCVLSQLLAGQGLVTREGAGLRWDGLAHGAAVGGAMAEGWGEGHIAHGLERECQQAQSRQSDAEAQYRTRESNWQRKVDELESDYRFCVQTCDGLAESRQKKQGEEVESGRQRAHLEGSVRAAKSECEGLRQHLEALAQEGSEAEAALGRCRVPDGEMESDSTSLETLRQRREELREERIRCEAAWQGRRAACHQREAELERVLATEERLKARSQTLHEQRQALAVRQREQGVVGENLLVDFTAAEQAWQAQEEAREETAARLHSAVQQRSESQRIQHQAALKTASWREKVSHLEVSVAEKVAARGMVQRLAEQALQMPISHLIETFGLDETLQEASAAEAESGVAEAEQRLGSLGEVNLRADIDAERKREELQVLEGERDDVVRAVAELRRAVADLNRQGRARLKETFEGLNRIFSEHFQRLFSGGEASLIWQESDDPLAPGIELKARPPGKVLQSVHLLSGGEKSLTALALIGGVLRLHPTPICLFDEVDAALDDANVARFCGLLSELGTDGMRFVVISHHRLSMAKADRLFGIGMPERGVSRLYGVDMHETF